jgi:RNA polymerase sigma-70 factor (ECF subfamily)
VATANGLRGESEGTFFDREAGLLERFREGERTALDTVYRAYVDSVARAVASALRRYGHQERHGGGWREVASELPDLVQEVFTRAFEPETRRRFDGVREYGPYLTQIARNVVVDCLRRKLRQVARDAGPLFDEVSLDLVPPVEPEDFADLQIMTLVGQYVEGLPEDLRRVHEALYVQGLSQRDAAEALGLGRQVVRTLESRLRRGLRRVLKECERPGTSRAVVARPWSLHTDDKRAR